MDENDRVKTLEQPPPDQTDLELNQMKRFRILIIRIDFLGDMICTTPLIQAIKNKWPDSEIHVLANKYNSPILENNPHISCVHTYVYSKQCKRNLEPGRLNAFIKRVALIFRLRSLKFDLGIIPNGGVNKNSIQFIRQLNIPDERWHTHATEFDDRNNDHVSNRPIIHECLSGFKLLPEINLPKTDELKLTVYPNYDLREEWLKKINSNKPKIGLFVSNKSVERKWDLSKWLNLIKSINSQADFFIFYDPTDKINSKYFSGLPATLVNTKSVQHMIAATSCMELIVSTDSAPVHLGSALNIPVVALFENRPEKYLRWHPIGVEYKLLKNKKIVNDIEVSAVIDAVNFFLDKQDKV